MPSDGVMILIIFAGIVLVPLAAVFAVIGILKLRRKRKIAHYKGVTEGSIYKIRHQGGDHPAVIYVRYRVSGKTLEIHETLKLKSTPIRAGRIPIGQRKTPVLGPVRRGDHVQVHYDRANPKKAIIWGNDGILNC